MMITPSVWAFYFFVFIIILRFLEVVADVCYVESWKNSGNLVIKNVVAFLRKKMIKKRFFDQKFAVIDFKVGISWRFFKLSLNFDRFYRKCWYCDCSDDPEATDFQRFQTKSKKSHL